MGLVQHKEVAGWLITTVWSDPRDYAAPIMVSVSMKEIASNDTAVSWTFDPTITDPINDAAAAVVFENEPHNTGEYAKFKIPLAALLSFVEAADVANAKALRFAAEGPREPPKPDPTLAELIQQYKDGTFVPSDWNLCIDWNSRSTGKQAEDGGIEFQKCIEFYVMGSGSGQCQHRFSWPVEKMTKERLEAWIKKTFNVDRVQYGVG